MLSSGNEPSKATNNASSSAAESTGGDLGAPVQSLAIETSSAFERTASDDTDETLTYKSTDDEEVNRYIGAKAHTYSPANSTPEGNDATHLSEMRQRVAENAKKLATLREEDNARVAALDLAISRARGGLWEIVHTRQFLHTVAVSAEATNSGESETDRESLESQRACLAALDVVIASASRTIQSLETMLALRMQSNVYRTANSILQICNAMADPSEREAFFEAVREQTRAERAAQQERVRESATRRDAAHERWRRTLVSLAAEALPALLDQDGVQCPYRRAYISFLRTEILEEFAEEGSTPLDA